MSEIKFACPHCRQHIACDGDYADHSIECPSCAGPMVVPRLSATAPAHPDMVIVASPAPPKPRPSRNVPALGFWNKSKWAEHTREAPDGPPGLASLGFVGLFATLVIAFILLLRGFGMGAIVGCLVIGSILTGCLRARYQGKSVAEGVISGLGFAVVLAVVVPVVAVGILFVGCTVCQ